jgi:[acyl-carrier-protein] S-malonyltransferase
MQHTKTAFVFPGQGAQYVGMGKDLYDNYPLARELMLQANEELGFALTDIMFEGSDEDLRQTRVTQPAIFLHSVVACRLLNQMRPDMVAGHSLGEFSALVIAGTLDMGDALRLVSERALAMQEACELCPGTMAAVLGLPDDKVSEICQISSLSPLNCSSQSERSLKCDNVAVAANYNYPGQVVISGSEVGVEQACKALKEAGAKRALKLPVGGAFHSPLMQPAAERLQKAIMNTPFYAPICPVYQNVSACAEKDKHVIQRQLLEQLTSPVRWTQSVQQMIADGATRFYEFGPGDVLKGLIRKINAEVEVG